MKISPYNRKNIRMNNTEAEYSHRLDVLAHSGDVQWWGWECMRIKVGSSDSERDVWYTPDFVVIRNEIMEIHEVKGFRRKDAMVRFKAGRQQYPFLRWFLVEKKKGEFIATEH